MENSQCSSSYTVTIKILHVMDILQASLESQSWELIQKYPMGMRKDFHEMEIVI